MNLIADLQQRVRECGNDVGAIIEISNEMHKYNCRVCPRNMYQDATSKTICPAMRGKPCRRNFATCWRRYFKEKEQGDAMSNVKKCCICGNQFDGVGNNTHPFMRGTCCDACNAKWVIPCRTFLTRKQTIRTEADRLAQTQIHKHADVVLNQYIGKRVALTMYDDCVEVGVLHVDTVAVHYCTYADNDNKEIIGYYLEGGKTELHFRKSHVKHIAVLDAANNVAPDVPIKTVYIPARDEHDGIHGAYVKLRWVCPKCGAPRGEVKSGRSYDGSRVLFCDTWQNPCGHVDKYADVRTEAAANGLNGDVMSVISPSSENPLPNWSSNSNANSFLMRPIRLFVRAFIMSVDSMYLSTGACFIMSLSPMSLAAILS